MDRELLKARYEKQKDNLLNNKKINPKNREVMKEFFEIQEYRLKRLRDLAELDFGNYRTLYFFIGKLKKINSWFKNKSWVDLTENDIRGVIDDLEDAKIKTEKGTRFSDRSSYYDLMKGRLFDLVDKSHFAKKMIKAYSLKGRDDGENDVRFITEENFKKIVDCAITPKQRCLMWLAFDIGENIASLLSLKRSDFVKQINEDTNEEEYLVYLKHNLKRKRKKRGELTNYSETVKFLDIVLKENKKSKPKMVYNRALKKCVDVTKLYDEDAVFKIGYKTAERFLLSAVKKANVRCEPNGEIVTWKDLRSSMACDLLKKEWTTDEINSRLGHAPSSRVIDKYVTFLALKGRSPKKKIHEGQIKELKKELKDQKELNKLQGLRVEKLMERLDKQDNNYQKLQYAVVDLMKEK